MKIVFRRPLLLSLVALLLVGWTGATARAHEFMQVQRLIGGVNGDASRQAIQLRMRAPAQNQVQSGRLVAYDAAGQNPIVLATFAGPVSNGQVGDHVLVCTPSFAAGTTPPTVADATMTPIPASYLAAGMVAWQDSGGTILWIICWGGMGYTGTTTGSLINDEDGNYGPPWVGALPSFGVRALNFRGPAEAPSVCNAENYGLTDGAAEFTNNAGTNFLIGDAPLPLGACCVNSGCREITQLECTQLGGEYNGDASTCVQPGVCPNACPCDWNHSGTLNSQDFFDFITGLFNLSGDFNMDNVTNSQDYFDFLACFFAPPGGC